MFDPSVSIAGPIPGMRMRRTEKGHPVIWLHYDADPTMQGERLEQEKARYNSEAVWRREMEIEYEALSGALIYPEFEERIHVIEHARIPREGCLFMSIDPHPRTPHAFLWILIDRWNDWYVYRELWPSIICGTGKRLTDSQEDNHFTIKEYAETIAFHCEGNELEWRHRGNEEKEYAIYRQRPGGERVITRMMDQAGKAFRASAEAALLETYNRRYSRYGIRCIDPRKSHGIGEDAVHSLLAPRKHEIYGDWPRLHISDRCPELIWEMKNSRFKVMKSEDPEKDLKQEQAEVRSHQTDNLRYLGTYPGAIYSARLASLRHGR